MACLFKNRYYRRCQGDSWWWIRYKDLDGRDRRERAAPTKREAEKLLALRVAAVAEGKKPPAKRDGSTLFNEFAAEYMEMMGDGLVWKQTVTGAIKLWEEHLGPRCKLRDISPRRIEAFRAKRLKAGIKRSTCNRNCAILRRLLNVAMDWDLLSENPARKVRQYREENARLRFLTKEEARRLVEACGRTRNRLLRPLVLLALNTGSRKGELLNLRWVDVNFEATTLSFRRTKNGERRDVPLNRVARETLHELRQQTGKDEHVFSRNGQRLTEVKTGWAVALGRAGLEDFRFHDLRHCFASEAVTNGMDLYRLQRILGHRTPKMTQRYAHLRPKDLREAVELVSFDGREERHVSDHPGRHGPRVDVDALVIDPDWTPESAVDGLEVLAVLGHLATAEDEGNTRILFAGSRQDLDELGGSYVAGNTEWLVIYARGGDVWQPATVRALARPGRQEDDPQHFEEL